MKVLLSLTQRYRRTPSEILHIEEPYDAYCLDEACAWVMSELDSGEKFYVNKHFKSASELYKSITTGR